MEQNLYEGRKGQKRLRALERQIEIIREEIQTDYEDTLEMRFLEEYIKWEITAKLIFLIVFRKVNLTWNGKRDYGFLRLAVKWIEDCGIKTITSADITEMAKAILTDEMCAELSEEIEELELF